MDELINECKELGIDYINKKTNKPFGKPALLKRIAEKNIDKIIEIKKEEILYKNEIIWTSKNNKEYNEYEIKLLNLIKKCHNILYSNGAIVGTDASNDIIKIIILRFINLIYNTEQGKNKIEDLLAKENSKIRERFISYIIDLKKILQDENGNYENEIKVYIQCLSRVLPNIFDGNDGILNTRNEPINILKLINEISDVITIDNVNFSNYFSTQGGNIYEYFTNGYSKGNNTSKDLGQFFTPFTLIQAILNGCGLNKLIRSFTNPTLYDPCCGSGGLLCITYKDNKDFINSNLIYGCEIEKKTIKYALGSFIINTNELNTNIINCNSLSKNPYIFEDKKFDLIFTNPPFGIKNNYKDKKKEFEEFRDKNYEDSKIKFEDVYPLNISDGTAMFIELVIYTLNINGICAIILPDGKMMDSSTFYKLRKFIIDKTKILKIINIEGGAFGHTTIKTKVMILQKKNNDGNNHKSIEFLEISKDCNEVKLLAITDLNLKTLSFNLENEKEEIVNNFNEDIEEIEFGEIFTLIKGTIQSSKVVEDVDGIILITGAKTFKQIKSIDNIKTINGNNLFISTNGNGDKIPIKYYENECYYSCLMSLCKIYDNFKDKINIKYIYYYLKQKQVYIEENYQKGLANKSLDVEKFNKMKIAIPSIEKQNEIVEYFDEFFKEKDMKILNNYSKNSFELLLTNPNDFKDKINKLYEINDTNENLKTSIENIKNVNKITLDIFVKNTECEIKTLGDVCTIDIGGTPLRDNQEYYNNGNNLWVSVRELNNNYIYDTKEKITDLGVLKSNCKLLSINTILMSFKLSIGKMGIAGKELYTNEAIAGINSKDNSIIINNYIYIYLLYNDISKKATGLLGNGSLNKKTLNLIKIPIPSIEKQEEIVKTLDNNDMIIKSLEKMIEDNKEMMKLIF